MTNTHKRLFCFSVVFREVSVFKLYLNYDRFHPVTKIIFRSSPGVPTHASQKVTPHENKGTKKRARRRRPQDIVVFATSSSAVWRRKTFLDDCTLEWLTDKTESQPHCSCRRTISWWQHVCSTRRCPPSLRGPLNPPPPHTHVKFQTSPICSITNVITPHLFIADTHTHTHTDEGCVWCVFKNVSTNHVQAFKPCASESYARKLAAHCGSQAIRGLQPGVQLSNLFCARVEVPSVMSAAGCNQCFMKVTDDQTSKPKKRQSFKKTTKTSTSVLNIHTHTPHPVGTEI